MLALTPQVYHQIINYGMTGAPQETCGFIAGPGQVGSIFYPIPNVAADRYQTFYMDPAAQLKALLEIERQGLELVAIYHTHPPGQGDQLSVSDRSAAQAYPGITHLLLLLGWSVRPASLRAFEVFGDTVEERPLLIQSML